MKYNDMIIENVTKAVLPELAKLLGDNSILMHDDICFEHSKYCKNENGEITAFIILRQHSLYDYFGGDIPLDRKIVKRRGLPKAISAGAAATACPTM